MRNLIFILLMAACFLIGPSMISLVESSAPASSKNADGSFYQGGYERITPSKSERVYYSGIRPWFEEEKCFAVARLFTRSRQPVMSVHLNPYQVSFEYKDQSKVKCRVTSDVVEFDYESPHFENMKRFTVPYIHKTTPIRVDYNGRQMQLGRTGTRFGPDNLSYREWLVQTPKGRKKFQIYLENHSPEAERHIKVVWKAFCTDHDPTAEVCENNAQTG